MSRGNTKGNKPKKSHPWRFFQYNPTPKKEIDWKCHFFDTQYSIFKKGGKIMKANGFRRNSKYTFPVILLIFIIGCTKKPNPCIVSCIDENIKVVHEHYLTIDELELNCFEYCNSPAIETEGLADGKMEFNDNDK